MKNIIHAIILNDFFKYHKSLDEEIKGKYIEEISEKISELIGDEKENIKEKIVKYLEKCNIINTLDMADHLHKELNFKNV